MNIIYSFNKTGFEAASIERELAAASDDRHTIIPFNHGRYLDPWSYRNATLLDILYRQQRHPALMKMYEDFQALIRQTSADAVVVDNAEPYHPDFLRGVDIYKVFFSTDDNINTYHA